MVRHLPNKEKPFLQYSSYLNISTKQVYDIVERPNNVLDILPFYKNNGKISILAKHGYPRPLANVQTGSPIIDDKHYSGYISECIAVGETDNIESILNSRFGITKDDYNNIADALNYYTSPGGINERVSSKFIELTGGTITKDVLKDNLSAFRESGTIYEYDAIQLLNTAQTGALAEARLELNIYNLLFKQNVPLPKWLGEKIKITFVQSISPTSFPELLSLQKQEYKKSNSETGFVTARRAYFAEIGVADSNAILEYVYPTKVSSNTLITLPVFRKGGQIYVGLETQSLPVPQIYSENSIIITAPAKRLPKEVQNIYDLESYISDMRIGKSKVGNFFKLGEKYFPSIGVTTEQVYPYVVCLSKVDKNLKWVSLADLYQNMDKIEDAHLLICINRLIHATEFLPDCNIRNLSFDNFIDFLKDSYYLSDKFPITRETLIERDLGITGDDGDELLIAIQDEFGINFCDNEGSIRKTFGMKDNEYLFHSEGFSLFNSSKEVIIPLSVGQLYDVTANLFNQLKSS